MRSTRTILSAALLAATSLASASHAAVTISAGKTKNENCAAGVCTPTGGNANVSVKDLQKMLAHSDVKIVTGSFDPNIGVLDAVTWASAHRLTLDASQSIHVRAPVVVEGTGGVTLITNDGGTGGDYDFNAATSGSIAFWDTSSSLVIDGASFALVNDIATLASDIAANASGNYALAKSYDASADGTYSNAPISNTFNGVFEGLGNSLLNLSIVAHVHGGSPNAGLFVRSAGTLRDITLANVNISVRSNQQGDAGALAIYNDGTIAHASVTGMVTGSVNYANGLAGGLVASNTGTIVQSNAAVGTGGPRAGGLVGQNESSGTIDASFATGDVYSGAEGIAGGLASANYGSISRSAASGNVGGGEVGGLVAVNFGAITLCRAAGEIFAYGTAGGLVADQAASTITQSFATGNVDGAGAAFTGGLVGYLRGGRIEQSYATGTARAPGKDHSVVGGLVGYNLARSGVTDITQSYAAGPVISWPKRYVGGLLGHDTHQGAHAETSYWDMDSSGIDDPGEGAGTPRNDPGITGLTDAQLKSGLPAGFDPNVWGQNPNINNGWPYLLANPPQ